MHHVTTSKQQKPYGFWNWGTALVFVLILGVSGIIFLVYRSMQMSAELVTENYYSEELQFQQKINARTAANGLSDSVRIHFDGKDAIIMAFPPECRQTGIQGSIYFYNPADGAKDFTQAIQIDPQGLQAISARNVTDGTYTVVVEWTMNQRQYRSELPFTKP